MTAPEATRAEPEPTQRAVLGDRRQCITRAAGLEAAGAAQDGRNRELVAPDQEPEYHLRNSLDDSSLVIATRLAHDVLVPTVPASLESSQSISPTVSSTAPGRAITIKSASLASLPRRCRNHCRIARFTRLRCTAFPTFRLTVMPSRGLASMRSCDWFRESGACAAVINITKFCELRRSPVRLIRRKSLDCRTRSVRVKRPVLSDTALLRRDFYGESVASLRSPTFQDCAARSGLHASSKTVGPFATNPTGLIGALHAGVRFPQTSWISWISRSFRALSDIARDRWFKTPF